MVFKRNIILFSVFLLFLIGSYFQHGLMNKKLDQLLDLKAEQKKVNEKFISADLLSKNLNRVLDLFNKNLALTAGDSKNDEASMPFLDNLTDLFVSLGIEVLDIKPISENAHLFEDKLFMSDYTSIMNCIDKWKFYNKCKDKFPLPKTFKYFG